MGADDPDRFAALLRTRRRAAGLTQEELAHRAGLSTRAVSDLERGVTRPYPRTLTALADALGLDEARREELVAAPRSDEGRGRGFDVPHQLPAAVPAFTGRRSEFAMLTHLLEPTSGAGASGPVVISAIGGTAGVGKTALAVQWAHQVADRFPGGQLYVNLRGYDPGQPMPAADALASFLRSLGMPGQDIPAATEERAAAYRSLVAGRPMLIVLDNAGTVEQIRPLLPGSPSCVTIVTSRDSLAGLVARDGARRLDLDLLPTAEAVALLRTLIGGRAEADPAATQALALRCARLPLALRVAAEFAATRPHSPLADLVRELSDQREQLDLLGAGGDPRTAVRAVFSWSYRHLDPAAARAFRLAGLHPGPYLDRPAIAALTGDTLAQAGRALDVLARAHLVQPAGPDRYSLHDLLRSYAAEQAATHDDCRAALTRLFDYYLCATGAAMDICYPAERHRRPAAPDTAAALPTLAGPAQALAWLDAQRASIVTVVGHAAAHDWPQHAVRLSATVFRYLDTGGHFPESLSIFTCAREAARRTGDLAAEATALNSLGTVHMIQGRTAESADCLRRSLELYRQAGDQASQTYPLSNLGLLAWWSGRGQQARDYYEQALAVCRAAGDRTAEVYHLARLSSVEQAEGHPERAIAQLELALALSRQSGHRDGQAMALTVLGRAEGRQGCYERAAEYLGQVIDLCLQTGDRITQAIALVDLGNVECQRGHPEQAIPRFETALALCRQTGHPVREVGALNGLGQAYLAAGQPGRARDMFTAALSLAGQIGHTRKQALAREGLRATARPLGSVAGG
ncbi:MAG TPA: tetratricopeptide repeat protein [Streptosporangiaceae bacterium]|jgi:tetratricopeptide (TPR) repeat protein/transcriptional regulator with XRE-family HTH domain